MTREEAILHMTLRRAELEHSVSDLDEDIKAFDMAIEALSAEPCEDAISRKALIEFLEKVTVTDGITFETGFKQILTDIRNAPSVQPKQKMDKLSVIYRDDGTHNPPMWEKPECPSCGYELGKLWGYPFCPKCGQALDWEEKV